MLEIIGECSGWSCAARPRPPHESSKPRHRLKVVGRAGVGVDNVDVDAATRRGIIVMNTPGGNTISTAEHAFSLMVSIGAQHPAGGREREGRQVGSKKL